jgi:hypothetical protein
LKATKIEIVSKKKNKIREGELDLWACSMDCGDFLSLETIKPNIIPENTINAHLSGFRLMPYYLHF